MADQPTVSDLEAKLPSGITLDTDYAATAPALLPVVDILSAFGEAQQSFNETNTVPGADVVSFSSGIGTDQIIFWPPGQTTVTATVRPRVYTVTAFQLVTLSETDFYPALG